MGWFLHGTWSLWHSSQWLVLYCMKVSTPEERQKKFFLVSKSFCFADSQSLLCEVDNWVYKSLIFFLPPYMSQTWFCTLDLMLPQKREFVCSSPACHCLLSLSSTAAVFCVQECEECCIWAGSGWNCYGNWFFFPAQLRNCVTRLL